MATFLISTLGATAVVAATLVGIPDPSAGTAVVPCEQVATASTSVPTGLEPLRIGCSRPAVAPSLHLGR